MQLINIMPLSQMADMLKQPMCMFLTHLVEKYPEYRKAAREYTGYKILDNSLIELGGSVSMGRLYSAAIQIDADEIILPDVFLNGDATFLSVCNALTEMRELDRAEGRHFKTMAVCQGRNVHEFEKCFESLVHLKGVDVIGIPKVCAKLAPTGRPYFEHLWTGVSKEIHLLGLWYSFEELERYKYPDKIRSVDSCLLSYFKAAGMPHNSVRPDGFTLNLETGQLTGGKV